MKLEDQVCSLELAIKLEKLGVKQDSLFYWYDYSEKNESAGISYTKGKIVGENTCSAFTVAELGELLPDCINGNKLLKNNNGILFNLNDHFIKSQKKDDEYKIYIDGLTEVTIFFSKNEANARAKMLIYLIENNLIELPK